MGGFYETVSFEAAAVALTLRTSARALTSFHVSAEFFYNHIPTRGLPFSTHEQISGFQTHPPSLYAKKKQYDVVMTTAQMAQVKRFIHDRSDATSAMALLNDM